MSSPFVSLSSPSAAPLFNSSPLLAPLKSLGNELKIPVTTIPHIRSELKTWTVHLLPLSARQIR
jgi:hypothetical protein